MAHTHKRNEQSQENLKVAFFINLVFTIIELIGGLLTNSMAILSDALHDLGDCISLGASWYLQKASKRKRNRSYTFGFRRLSLAGAIINSLVLLTGSIFIISESIPRLFNPSMPEVKGMMILGVLGLVFNGLAFWRLHGGSSLNEKAVSLHLLEDVLGWVAVLIGAGIMYFYDAPVIDPLLSLLIAAWILFNIFKNLKKSFRIILQAVPDDQDLDEVEQKILSIEGVESIHDLHLWSMEGENHVLSCHIVLRDDLLNLEDQTEVKMKCKRELAQMGIGHVTIEFESSSEECMPLYH